MSDEVLRQLIRKTLLLSEVKSYNAGNAAEGLVAAALGAAFMIHGNGEDRLVTSADVLNILSSASGMVYTTTLGSGDSLTVEMDVGAARDNIALQMVGSEEVEDLNDYMLAAVNYANRKSIQKFAKRLAVKAYGSSRDRAPDEPDDILVSVIGTKDRRSPEAKGQDPTADVAVFVNDMRAPTSLTPSVKIKASSQLAQGRGDFSTDTSPAQRLVRGISNDAGFRKKLGSLIEIPAVSSAVIDLESEISKIIDPINDALGADGRVASSRDDIYTAVNNTIRHLGLELGGPGDEIDSMLERIAEDALLPFAEALAQAMTRPPKNDQGWQDNVLPKIADFFGASVGSQEFVKLDRSGEALRGRPSAFEQGITDATKSEGRFQAVYPGTGPTVYVKLGNQEVFQLRLRRDAAKSKEGYTFTVRLYLEAKDNQALTKLMAVNDSITLLKNVIYESLMLAEELTKSDKKEIEKIARKQIAKDMLAKKEIEKIAKQQVEDGIKKALGVSFLGTKGDINKFVSDATKDQAEKWLGDKSTKDEIANITKSVMKKLYKDLSFTYPSVIDRIKV